MKKNRLLWCLVLPIVQVLSGCNTVASSNCSTPCSCQCLSGLFQQTSKSLGKKDETKKSLVNETTNKVVRRDQATTVSSGKTSNGTPNRTVVNKPSSKEPPVQAIIIENRNDVPVAKQAPASLVLPDLKIAPPPVPTAVAVPRSPVPARAQAVSQAPPNLKPVANATKKTPIHMGANEDYTILAGRVQVWRQTIRLRYAPIDQVDTHGGCVVLGGDLDLGRLRDDQHIRVRGLLMPAEDRNSSAFFRVDAVEILD